jgi:DNA-binding transcriptional regulator of glucitol operon
LCLLALLLFVVPIALAGVQWSRFPNFGGVAAIVA